MSWIRAACGGGWHPCDSCSGPSAGWHLAGLNLGIDANILNHIRNTVGFDCITLAKLHGMEPGAMVDQYKWAALARLHELDQGSMWWWLASL